ncbi:MAG: ribosomal protein S18-alanine N-acetyltransferase [Desulfobacterales bacterium]
MSPWRAEHAAADDLDRLVALESACFPEPWGAESLAAPPNPALEESLVVRAPGGGEPIGFLRYRVVEDEAEVLRLAVHPGWRRRGVGASLLAEGLCRIARRGGRRVFLETEASNAAARAFYRAFGFLEIARRRGYYRAGGEDAVVLTFHLQGGTR